MFVEAFPKFNNAKIVRALRAYFGSVWHVIVVALIMTLSAVFSLEIAAAYCYLAIAVLVCLFCEDVRALVSVIICVPMSLSIPNNLSNPSAVFAETIFADNAAMLQIGFCVAVAAVLLVGRLVAMLITGRGGRGMPRLTIGFLLLFAAYLLGGLLSPYYSVSTVLFGALQCLMIGLAYFYFYYTVDWKKTPKGYIASVFAVIGFALVIQVLNMYFRNSVVVDGVIERGYLYPGWGTYNNIGCVTAMCIPAICYFAVTQKHGWIFTLLAATVMAGVILTQSRGSILFGGIVYVAGMIIVLVKSKSRERLLHCIVIAVIVIAIAICVFVFREKLQNLFNALLRVKTDDAGRKELFIQAWDYFRKYPVFGVGWGGERWIQNGNNFLLFFMAHNTFLQVLGSLGVVGMIAYLFHRFQTLKMVFRKFSIEKCFTALIAFDVLFMSMMDVHVFIVETAMFYSIVLVFLEGIDKREGNEPPKKRWRRKNKKTEKTEA